MNGKIIRTVENIAASAERFSSAKVGAVLAIRNEIISIGFNQKKTHPLQRRFSKNEDCIYLHAEIDAIKNALRLNDPELLSKCTLYVSRVKCVSTHDKTLILGIAKPCAGCMKAIRKYRIPEVIYSTDENTYEYLVR